MYENTFKTRSETFVNKENPTCEMRFILFLLSSLFVATASPSCATARASMYMNNETT